MLKKGFVRIEIGRRPNGRPSSRRSMVVTMRGGVRLSFGDVVDPRVVHAVFEAVRKIEGRGPC
jgi:hypothetical protein